MPRSIRALAPEHRVPTPILLVDADRSRANATLEVFQRELGRRVWVCHEPNLAVALRLLQSFCFRLIVVDPMGLGEPPEAVLQSLALSAGDTPSIVVGLPAGGSTAGLLEPAARFGIPSAAVAAGDPSALIAVVRRKLQLTDRA
jgi:hypothetical protein